MSRASSLVSVTMMALVAAACGEERPPLGAPPVGSGGDLGSGGAGGGTSSGGGGSAMSTGGSGGEDSTPDYTPCASPPAAYPSAPYGHDLGDTMALLDLEGFVNADGMDLANTEPFIPFGMEAIRGAGTTHVMLHLAATW